MKLSGKDLEKLVGVMLSAYPDKNNLEQLVRFNLDQSLDEIVKEQTTKDMIFQLISWVQARGKLIDLLNAIAEDRPNHVELQNTIKNLQKKYSQLSPDQDDQSSPKKNKLSLFIWYFLGILIIPTGIIGYKFYDIYYQPKLACDDPQLQKQDNSIKIVVPDFAGNPDPDLKTSLKEILKTQIPSDVTICKFNQKVKESSEANQLGKRLFPKHPNSVLVIWGRSSQFSFSGGIESIDDNSNDILLDISLDEKDQSKFKDTSLTTLDLQINYGIASLYYFQDNKNNTWNSQRLLERKLAGIIGCKVNNEIVTTNYNQLTDINLKQIKKIAAESYSLLGDSYLENKNFENAIESYKCSYNFEIDQNKRDILLLEQAAIYDQHLNNIEQSLKIYQKVINEGTNDSKTRALVSQAMIFAIRKECPKAEKNLAEVINKNLDIPYGLHARSHIRLFNCPNKLLGAIEDLSKFYEIDPKNSQNAIDSYSQTIRNRSDYQQIVSELQEIQKTHPEWKQLINQLLEKDNSK
jgi:hypothetical protein